MSFNFVIYLKIQLKGVIRRRSGDLQQSNIGIKIHNEIKAFEKTKIIFKIQITEKAGKKLAIH